MGDAILLGMEEAVKYYDNLQLTEVHSFDNDQSMNEFAGDIKVFGEVTVYVILRWNGWISEYVLSTIFLIAKNI